jgi:mono/diheme cytochrome c family protein
MSTRSLLAATLLTPLLLAGPTLALHPKLGQPISESDLAAWDISIGPDGVGLPAGSGTSAQGATIYAGKCAVCHGEKGEGKVAARLVGGQGTLTEADSVKTVGSYWPYATTLFDYIRRAMPWNQPKTLTNDEVYALSAYILALNGIIKDGDTMNKDTLAKVAMPNRDGFIQMYPTKH